MDTLVLSAPAKVNLGLWVGRKRPDGYHEVVTVIAPLELSDTVTVSRTGKGIGVRCSSSEAPSGPANLAHKAAVVFFKSARIKAGCRIRIRKRIPVGGGLGGGSSDAAAVLIGLNRLFRRALSPRRLRTLGASLGSDVPALLLGRPCLARGRGERLRPIRLPRLDVLLCLPGYPVSTAWAYAELDLSGRAGRGLTRCAISSKILRASLERNEPDRLAAQLTNSFEPVVFKRHPSLGRVKELLLGHGAYAAALSGSGSTVYGLVEPKGWKDPMAALARNGFHCLKTRTIATAE